MAQEVAYSMRGERRRRALTILFSDLSNSTQLAANLDPETYADFLEEIRAAFERIVARHQGVIARIDGDGVLCIFGLQDQHGRATRYAITAALELRDEIPLLANRLGFEKGQARLHCGINTGVVLLGDGDIVRGRFEVLGDVTNVAARLCDFAREDEIVITQATLGADSRFFELTQPRDVIVAGRAGKTKVVKIRRAKTSGLHHATSLQASAMPFVGRENQLRQLRAWLAHTPFDDLTHGPNKPLLIYGPPGIGKTRVVNEFIERIETPDVIVLRAMCEDQLGTALLHPFIQLLGGMQANHAPKSYPPGLTTSIDASAIAFCQHMINHAQGKQTLFVVEDWHWANQSDRLMMSYCLGLLPDTFKILLTSRNSDLGLNSDNACSRLEIPPWTDAEIWQAAEAKLGLPDVVIGEWLQTSCGGNPLFLEELCHSLARSEVDRHSNSKNVWLEALIQARFEALPMSQQELLQAAAVLGYVVPIWLFETIGLKKFDEHVVAQLAAADFLYPSELSGMLRFKHGITRDAIYELIGPRRRRELHARAADALSARALIDKQGEHLDALTRHNLAAERTEQALEGCISLGDAALEAGSFDRARHHFLNAFSLVPKLQDLARAEKLIWAVTNKYGLACITDPSPEQLYPLSAMVAALERFGTDRQKARGAYWLGTLHYGLGNGFQAVKYLKQALAIAQAMSDGERLSQGSNTSLLQQIETKLAQSLFAAGEYRAAGAAFRKLFGDLATYPYENDDIATRYALSCYAFMLADQGNYDAIGSQSMPAERVMTDTFSSLNASVFTYRLTVSMFQEDWNNVIAQSKSCLNTAIYVHTPYQSMISRAQMANALWKQTRDPSHLEQLDFAASWFDGHASQQRSSIIYSVASQAYFEGHDTMRCRKYAARALLRARVAGDILGLPLTYRVLAQLSARFQRTAHVQRYLKLAFRASDTKVSPRERSATIAIEATIAAGSCQSPQ